jgi:hypothetical protein
MEPSREEGISPSNSVAFASRASPTCRVPSHSDSRAWRRSGNKFETTFTSKFAQRPAARRAAQPDYASMHAQQDAVWKHAVHVVIFT